MIYSKFLKLVFLVCLMLSFANICALSAQTIKVEGIVIDAETGTSIQGANAYIKGTTMGSSTNIDGEFSFETTLNTVEELTVSFIGYHYQTFPINFSEGKNEYYFKVELIKNEIQLDDIVVIDDNSLWLNNFEDFKREFIGTSKFAQNTTIINKWVIDFLKESNGELYAMASEPIIVENQALGYRMQINMKDFLWKLNSGTGHFYFDIEFQELQAQTELEYENWQRNRRDAYNGSSKHFYKSLFHDELNRNSFEVVEKGGKRSARIYSQGTNLKVIRLLMRHRIPISQFNEEVKAFSINGSIDILQGHGPVEISHARRALLTDNRRRAGLRPDIDNMIFLVNKNGGLLDPQNMSVEGYFTEERIANMLPENYQP